MDVDYSKWIGRTESVAEVPATATVKSAAAMFDEDPESFHDGSDLPPLWHWFHFLGKVPQSGLGADGHPARREDSFMPPIPLPRRMFAGARLKWHRPLVTGRPAIREATIQSVSSKSGRSGQLAFVTVGYRVLQDEVVCVEEEQDIVYREPGAPTPAPVPGELPPLPAGARSETIVPDTRLLFRFSALTFNAHRIHYDRPYAMNVEGYPGLVVHGPLTAILLIRLAQRNHPGSPRAFSFRSQGPLFDLAPFRLVAIPSGDQVELEAQGPDGKIAMKANAEMGCIG